MTSAAENRAVIERFYTAFQHHDAAGMNACYTTDIRFRDPVFQDLAGDEVRAMWNMLNSRNAGLELAFQVGTVDDAEGHATWVAKYHFSATGRDVENHVHSHLWLKDGLIARQEDQFDLWRWASMALGPRGQFLGWLPPVQGSIRKQARGNLDRFMSQGQGEKRPN
ncbi:MAG: nuclear transport factor 2 family protein [Candidatus Dormibacteria bacterium]